MDPVTIAFYALVCACLGVAAPRLGRAVTRLVVGAAVGVLAAAALPVLRASVGF